jgi:chemotaxis-related protein WspB
MLAVTFRVGTSAYAIRYRNVVEVIPRVQLRAVAHTPDWVAGVFAYRGALTPVVDLCRLLAGYACPERLSSRVVLVRCSQPDGGERTLGLLAEQMTEARHLPANLVSGPSLSDLRYFAEVVLEGGEPLQFLNVDAILSESGVALGAPSAAPRMTSGEEDRKPSQP